MNFNGSDVTADYEPLMQWKRKLSNGTEQEMTEFAGKRSITLDSSYVSDGDIVITCTIMPSNDSLNQYGSMEVVKEGNQLVLKRTPAAVNNPGHDFKVLNGELVLIIPEFEETPSAEVENVTEEYMKGIPEEIEKEQVEFEDTEADTEVPEGFEEAADIVEPEEADDEGTDPDVYIEGEEEAKDYVEEINETVDVFVEVDDIEDEDTTGSLKGNNYVLEDGVLGVYVMLNQPMSAYATVYSTEPKEKVEFKYNANGLRTQKKHYAEDGSVTTTDYTLHGKLITHLTRRTVPNEGEETVEELHFFYDAQSRPAMVEYGGQLYSYLHNLQGDIIGIVDAAGSLVVEYKYDAWGKPIYEAGSLLSTLGNLNPFRYRGYVWDEETELYYLRSRYYIPMCIRFINADTVLGKIGTLDSRNLFMFCGNNPVMKVDPDGASDESAVRRFFRKSLKGYDFGLATVLNAIVKKWNNRTATEKVLRAQYNIPASAKCEISYNVKEITSFDKYAEYVVNTAFGALLGLGGNKFSSIAGGILGFKQADSDAPDVGMYAGITYSFTHEYRVISGDIDNHTGMECQTFTATWVIEEYTNGVNTYFDVAFDDTGIGQMGIFVDFCNLHP